jgi:hypothetical protein
MLRQRHPSSIHFLAGAAVAVASLILASPPAPPAGDSGGAVHARSHTLGEFLFPIDHMVGGEVTAAVLARLVAATAVIDQKLIDEVAHAAEDAVNSAADGTTGWKFERQGNPTISVREGWKKGASAYLLRRAPRDGDTLGTLAGNIVLADLRRQLMEGVSDALAPFVGERVDGRVTGAARDAVASAMERVAGGWVCTYHRPSGTMKWYNSSTGQWGDPCFQ